jgi:S-adenosylmethionine:tRNA ribosyltransferase-isomerase
MSEFSPMGADIDNYDYALPQQRIARYPLEDPAGSKLLVYDRGKISHSEFRRIPEYINSGELVIFNNTKVIQARIIMYKPTGSKIEILLLEPTSPPEYHLAFSSEYACNWKCMTGNKKRWKGGPLVREFSAGGIKTKLSAEIVYDHGHWQEIKFMWGAPEISFSQVIECAGLTPIPPYLNRDSEELDKNRYQTVYSRFEGSVAAPTAGLHFTKELLRELDRHGALSGEVTLHVGAGTFQPVKARNIDQHEMHTEYFSVDTGTLEKIMSNQGNITAVGTTSARTLETLYWLGVKLITCGGDIMPQQLLLQGEVSELPVNIPVHQALEALLGELDRNGKKQLNARTQLMITPGYSFRLVKKLITNFHQPRSTLLLLIAAFIGEDWKKVYNYALNNDFRFLSYGDSSILMPARDGLS